MENQQQQFAQQQDFNQSQLMAKLSAAGAMGQNQAVQNQIQFLAGQEGAVHQGSQYADNMDQSMANTVANDKNVKDYEQLLKLHLSLSQNGEQDISQILSTLDPQQQQQLLGNLQNSIQSQMVPQNAISSATQQLNDMSSIGQVAQLGQQNNQNGHPQIPQDSTHLYQHQEKQVARKEQLEEEEEVLFHIPSSTVILDQAKVKNTYTKLEKLLAQPDIFDTLRKIGNGQIRNYDDLDINATVKYQAKLALKQKQRSQRAASGVVEEDESEKEKDDEFQIYQLDAQPQNIVGGQLKDYQLEGLNWLFRLYQANLNGILADEMGLGKTIQSIAIIALVESLKKPHEIMNRFSHHIVIVPKVTLGKWLKEIRQWVPSLRVFQFYGNCQEREEQRKVLLSHKYDVILTTFETCMREKRDLSHINYEYLILDEAQRIKNQQSVLSQNLRQFKARNRILLTGTPLQNEIKELWSLLNFLMPKLFESADEFTQLFALADKQKDDQEEQQKVITQIHRLLRPFMLRRLKIEKEHALPPKEEIHLSIGLTKLQKQLYKKIITGNISTVNDNNCKDRIQLLNVLMQLKKVCNHPYLFENVEPGPPFLDGDHIIDASMKFRILDHLIPKLIGEDCKILIFCQMTKLMDILDDMLRIRGYKYCRIDGQTPAHERDNRIDDFQNPESEKKIFILSTRAGGIGINLHQANIVIIFDSDWNPQVDLQAIDRAHRIGQKRKVIIYRLVTKESVEEKIVERAARKLRIDHLIMQRGKFNQSDSKKKNKVSADEMISMIQHGAQEIILSCDQEAEDLKANLDEIIQQSLKKTEEFNQKLKSIDEKFNLNTVSFTNIEDDNSKYKKIKLKMDDDDAKKKIGGESATAGILPPGFIDIGKRQRPTPAVDYSKPNPQPKKDFKKKPNRGWRNQIGGFDHQFLDSQKLDQLEQKENEWEKYKANPEDYTKDGKEAPPEYTKEDADQFQQVMNEGFPQWNKRDFFKFINMCELFGRHNCELYNDLHGKTLEEIKSYSEAFWKNYTKIEHYKKYIDKIEKGEAEIDKRRRIDLAIEDKFKKLREDYLAKNPDAKDYSGFNLRDINIVYEYPISDADRFANPFEFHPDEDRLYALCMHKYTYGFWDLIKNEVRNCTYLYFNWVAQSRTTLDIQKRCDFLIQQFKFELYGEKTELPVEIPPKELKKKEPKQAKDEKKASKTKNTTEASGTGRKFEGKTRKNGVAATNDDGNMEAQQDSAEGSKNLDQDLQEQSDIEDQQNADDESYNGNGKKRGSYKKKSTAQAADKEAKKRGRKPKKRGRKPKNEKLAQASNDDPNDDSNSPSALKKRSNKERSQGDNSDAGDSAGAEDNGATKIHKSASSNQIILVVDAPKGDVDLSQDGSAAPNRNPDQSAEAGASGEHPDVANKENGALDRRKQTKIIQINYSEQADAQNGEQQEKAGGEKQ